MLTKYFTKSKIRRDIFEIVPPVESFVNSIFCVNVSIKIKIILLEKHWVGSKILLELQYLNRSVRQYFIRLNATLTSKSYCSQRAYGLKCHSNYSIKIILFAKYFARSKCDLNYSIKIILFVKTFVCSKYYSNCSIKMYLKLAASKCRRNCSIKIDLFVESFVRSKYYSNCNIKMTPR